jgi:hypothetical protein
MKAYRGEGVYSYIHRTIAAVIRISAVDRGEGLAFTFVDLAPGKI